MKETNVRCRLLQICDELKAEGYRVAGSLGSTVFALRHTNGNRMTITYANGKIGYLKNGHLVKVESVKTVTASPARTKPEAGRDES